MEQRFLYQRQHHLQDNCRRDRRLLHPRPAAVVESLAKDVGATMQSNSDYYFLPCGTALPDFVLKAIDEHKISSGDLLLPTSDPSSCILAMLPLDSNGILPSWTLGTPLMRHHCGVYDISGFNYGIADSY